MKEKIFIAVDLDGTLAEYEGDYMPGRIGRPISLMVNRVKRWLAEGKTVKIFTARVASNNHLAQKNRQLIEKWCKMFIGVTLPVTAEKDPLMIEFWDDKAVQIIPNTGLRADGKN